MERQTLKRQLLEELHLIQCSLLPDEHLKFLDDLESWHRALDKYANDPLGEFSFPGSGALFSIRLDGGRVWFEATLSEAQHVGASLGGFVSVKGEDISRDEQERWQGVIAKNLKDLQESDTEYTFYQLISMHLLPLMHEDLDRQSSLQYQQPGYPSASKASRASEKEIYHALFTSHHLISPNKRRSLQQWSSSLSLSGFAKVGYPSVIYAQGKRSDIEEFVDNVKTMQWLALKLRFTEPSPTLKQNSDMHLHGDGLGGRPWKEFEKVGEVVAEMRRIGREEYVIEMGIGNAGSK